MKQQTISEIILYVGSALLFSFSIAICVQILGSVGDIMYIPPLPQGPSIGVLTVQPEALSFGEVLT